MGSRIPPKFSYLLVMSWYQSILASVTAWFDQPVERSQREQQRVDRIAATLTLYTRNHCTECVHLLRQLKKLNVSITVKNIRRCHIYQKELLAAGQSTNIPCLRIEKGQQVRWISQADDIDRFFDQKFAPIAQNERLEQAH